LVNYLTRVFINFKLFVSSSQEPDAKRQRVEDGTSDEVNAAADAQANNSAYNNWYQVGFLSADHGTEKDVFTFSLSNQARLDIYSYIQYIIYCTSGTTDGN